MTTRTGYVVPGDDVLVPHERIPPAYRAVMTLAAPIVRWWGRLEVVGADVLPASGAALLIANHDSAWDPLILGVAAMPRRQLRALAKSSLWRAPPAAWLLDQMGQIPIERGRFDTQALAVAIEALRAGACVGIFPEGTVSRGQPLRPLSGAGRLALSAPGAPVICASVSGAVDVVRFPKRPQIRVEFFPPSGGPPRPGETAVGLTKRTMAEVRDRAPFAVPGRRRKAAEFRRLAAEAASPRP
ncbi:MAG: 1-acyl-sn-glycerol-3-phosphate acyltransferase [Actinomycetota bacterium]|nr:1-acyl-sn-glycerol-3-phosphate acyltransferase [Actinomycetota bacterium]